MYARTLPREIAARWIKAGDEVATFEAENGAGDNDSELRMFCRTERYTNAARPWIDWWLVINSAQVIGRRTPVTTDGNTWFAVVTPDGVSLPVPDDLDPTYRVALVMAPIINGILGAARTVFAKEGETFVIRERVKVDPLEFTEQCLEQIESNARSLRLLPPKESTEDQRGSARVTVAEIDADNDDRLPSARCGDFKEHGPHAWQDGSHVKMGPWYRCQGCTDRGEAREVGEATKRLPVRRIPIGVLGMSMGRHVEESAAVDFRSERESADR